MNELIVHILTRTHTVRRARIGLRGTHQASNAQLAVAALDLLCIGRTISEFDRRITDRTIVRGLERVTLNTGFRGRLETRGSRDRFILDVAHNPAGMQALVCALEQARMRDVIVVFGVMKDKEYGLMLETLRPLALCIIAVSPALGRALKSQKIYHALMRRGIPGECGGSVARGIHRADALAGLRGRILITGSHYVVGEALAFLLTKSA